MIQESVILRIVDVGEIDAACRNTASDEKIFGTH